MLPLVYLPDVTVLATKFAYDRKTFRSKQVKPYDLPTDYRRKARFLTELSGTYAWYSADVNYNFEEDPNVNTLRQYAYNKAYERFVSKLGDNSQFGATLTAERRETLGMITKFVMQGFRAGRCAKRGDILGVLHNLGFNPPLKQVTRTYRRKRRGRIRISQEYYRMPDGKLVLKSAASSWLLWSYGISPLIDDLHNGAKSLVQEVPVSLPIRGQKTEVFDDMRVSEGGGTRHRNNWSGRVRVLISAEVSVSNPDLFLANQLGLTNPMQWLNEAIPFSFVADWCSNWSSVLMSLTDFMGVDLKKQCISTKYSINQDFTQYTLPPYVPATQVVGRLKSENILYERFQVPIQRPKLMFRYERFEVRRALNAISLLVGLLPHNRKTT